MDETDSDMRGVDGLGITVKPLAGDEGVEMLQFSCACLANVDHKRGSYCKVFLL